MNWSTELWDQFDVISGHTSKGVDFLDKLGHFVKERCMIETDYASRLKKLAKAYDLNNKRKDDEKDFTYFKAFSQVLRELTAMAGQHEVIAENLSSQIVKEITTICKDLRDERKRHLNEGVKYQNLLTNSLNQLDKSKKSYDKAFRDAAKARDNYQKADKDLNLSRAELEKAKTASLIKDRAYEDSQGNYAKQLQVTNEAQREHYTQFMPKVFLQLQDMENRRIECTKNFLKLSAIIQKNVMPVINNRLDGIIDAANLIDASADTQLVIERFKSGMQPPDDIPFENLNEKTNCDSDSVSTQSKGSSLVYSHSLKSEFRHTFTARGFKKRSGILGLFGTSKNEYSGLPPNQKRKKIQAEIDRLNKEIKKAEDEKGGLDKMRQAYEENKEFGDPKKIESELRANEATLERLNNELSKHLILLDEVHEINRNNSATNNFTTPDQDALSKSPSINNHRTSYGPDSELSRTNSDNSLRRDSNNINADGTKNSATICTSNSFNDSITDSISNNASSSAQPAAAAPPLDTTDGCQQDEIQNQTQKQSDESNNHSATNIINAQELDNSTGEVYEMPGELPIQALAKALYPFKSEPMGSISMEENEQFDVIEFDQGDGWTRVRRKIFNPDDDDFIGFVPTSYIAIETIPQSPAISNSNNSNTTNNSNNIQTIAATTTTIT